MPEIGILDGKFRDRDKQTGQELDTNTHSSLRLMPRKIPHRKKTALKEQHRRRST